MIEPVFIIKFKFKKLEFFKRVEIKIIAEKTKPKTKLTTNSFLWKNCKTKQFDIKMLTQAHAKVRFGIQFIGSLKNVNVAERIANKVNKVANETTKKISIRLDVFLKFKL